MWGAQLITDRPPGGQLSKLSRRWQKTNISKRNLRAVQKREAEWGVQHTPTAKLATHPGDWPADLLALCSGRAPSLCSSTVIFLR